MKALIVKKGEEGQTLLSFLRASLPSYPSVKAIKKAIDQKRCTVNEKVEWFSTYRVHVGDRIEISFEEKEAIPKTAILYEEKEWLAVSKPAGIKTESFSENYLLVHRLDKETSGVLLLAKTKEAQTSLTDLFRKREIVKEYLAICDGNIAHDKWMVENELGVKVRYQGGVLYGRVQKGRGKEAITFFETLKRAKMATLVLARPKTGRTHQIRVHLKEGGHPILGDWQYSSKFRCPIRPSRQMLHALRLQFLKEGKKVVLEAPVPNDFFMMQKKLFGA